MSQAWTFALARVAAGIGAAIGLGLVFGWIWLWLVVVLGGLLCWQLVSLFRLERWVRHRSQEDPPDLGGIWGDVVGLIGLIHRRKLYHKRRVTQLLREFRRLSAAMPDGVVLLSPAFEIIWFNRTASLLLGLKRKADRGMPIENLIRQPEFSTYLHGSGAGAGVILRPQGGERVLALIVLAAGGQHLLLARDVTREVRLEQMRKDFVANASHELRSPLTVISGYLDQLDEGIELGAEWREPISDMRLQADRMREIVDDLLEISRMESSTDEAPMLPVNVPELLERLVHEARASAVIPPRFELDIKAERGLLGSERELHSIASNLISNAVKYTPVDGTITVRWTCDDAGAHLSIVDTGIGIAAEHLPRLTERFYRADKARARASGGSGLGLSIVKHGLQRHGGQLEIMSGEGHGSTFTAHFPSRRLLPATSVPGRARG